jgi:hypothetical protein
MTTDTLMTDAATTTEGNASQDAAGTSAAPATAPTAPTAPDASTQQQATDAQTTDAAKADGGEAKGDEAKPQGAPEKYEFAMPEGVHMDEAGLAAFSEVAKELDLSQEAAQKVIDKMAPAMAARQAEAIEAVRTEWAEGSRADKEFGGDKLPENLATAKKALDTFGTPELRTLLNETGLGNHPEIIRAFYRAGKAISEDRFVASSNGGPPGSRDLAKSLYPNQQS